MSDKVCGVECDLDEDEIVAISIRFKAHQHHAVRIAAAMAGVSFNTYVTTVMLDQAMTDIDKFVNNRDAAEQEDLCDSCSEVQPEGE